MSAINSKVRLIGACAALASLALAISCRGFFVNPTLTSMAIGPANLSLAPQQTYQMVATGTFSDGSTADITSKSQWTSTNPGVASFVAAGKLQAANFTDLVNQGTLPGQTTVSASDGTVSSSTQTVNVCPVVQTLTFKVNGSSSSSVSVPGGQPVAFVATATFNGLTGTTDVTNAVTWNISNTSLLPSITDGSGTPLSGMVGQSTNVSATLCSTTSNTVIITTSS